MGLQGRSKNRERMKTSNLLKVNVEDILKSKQRMNGLQSTGFGTYLDNITGVRTFFKESISVLEKIKNNSFCYS